MTEQISLLEFVLELVDDDSAGMALRAQFERDPHGTLAEYGLSGLTAEDVHDALVLVEDNHTVSFDRAAAGWHSLDAGPADPAYHGYAGAAPPQPWSDDLGDAAAFGRGGAASGDAGEVGDSFRGHATAGHPVHGLADDGPIDHGTGDGDLHHAFDTDPSGDADGTHPTDAPIDPHDLHAG